MTPPKLSVSAKTFHIEEKNKQQQKPNKNNKKKRLLSPVRGESKEYLLLYKFKKVYIIFITNNTEFESPHSPSPSLLVSNILSSSHESFLL